MSALLERMTSDWLAEHRNGYGDDEQGAIRKRVMATVGTIRGSDPTRAERAGELVREIIARKHEKESRAFARTYRRTD